VSDVERTTAAPGERREVHIPGSEEEEAERRERQRAEAEEDEDVRDGNEAG